MDVWDIILGIVAVIGVWLTASKIQGYEFTISELKDENRRLEKNLEITESSKEWLSKLYDDLLEQHEMLLGKYNPPPRWWESEESNQDKKEETNDKNSTLH